MQTVLDLDLDFFVWPPYTDGPVRKRLPKTRYSKVASEEDVRAFLEDRCGLSENTPVLGVEAEEHVDAFAAWRCWIEQGILTPRFNVVHVDAHFDLGSGFNNSAVFFETHVLALPLEKRSELPLGVKALNSGNYLVAAVANQWIEKLTYVYPTDPTPKAASTGEGRTTADVLHELLIARGTETEGPPVSDLPGWVLKNGDWRTGALELKQYRSEDITRWDATPVHIEPSVPFELVRGDEFKLTEFTHLFLAHSPQYCPLEADKLLPVIRRYFSSR